MYRYISKYILLVKKRILKGIEVGADAFLTKGSCDQLIFWHLSKTLSGFSQH